MKKGTKSFIITGLVAALGISSIASAADLESSTGEASVDAGNLKGRHQLRIQDPERLEHMEQVKEAIANGDYNTWYELMTENDRTPQILEVINADNFYLLQEMHQARADRDMERAKEIADELGLKQPMNRMKNKGELRCRQEISGEQKTMADA